MQPKPTPLTPAEYLTREEKSPVKCEYVNGEVYAMSGATRRHNVIAANLLGRAWQAASSHPGCQPFGSDMKIYVETFNSFYYPDFSVCCDRNDRNELFVSQPCFIAEVLSPATASIDRREKRAAYTSLESLREYLIVDQGRMHAELYRRVGGVWQGYILNQLDDAVPVSCLDLTLTLEQIYQGVELPAPGVGEPATDYELNEPSL